MTAVTSKEIVPVAISGGGPCGLMMALLLARAGVPSVVFEKKSGLSTHPKAMGVSRRTAEIYRQIGLLDRIVEGSLSVTSPWLGFWAKSLVGEELGRVPLVEHNSPLTPCQSLHCPQTWTEQALYEAVQKQSLAEVRFDTEVVSVREGDEAVHLILSSGEEVAASWLVAADGAGSLIRHQLGIGAVGPGDMGHFINVMFRAPYGTYLRDREAILYHALSESYFENFVAVNGDDLWLMHHFLQLGEEIGDYDAERFAGIIRKASGLPDVPVEVLSLSPWVMSPKVAEQVRIGRVLLIGDAAARLSPAGGLGLNTGLQSTHNLAWKLAAVFHGQAADSLLDTYQSERREVALATMQNTNGNAEEIFATVMAGMQGEWDKVRELIAHSRRGGAGLGQDLGVSYTAGAFVDDGTPAPVVGDVVNDYAPTGRPGGRAPHLWIDEGTRSLLDLLGMGFVLFVGREGTQWQAPPDVAMYRNGADFTASEFESVYGINVSGAVLVRPDGYVAARFSDAPGDSPAVLREVLRKILGR